MPTGYRLRIAIVAAAVAAAAAAVILLNLALLGYAQPRNDPVGKLSPRTTLLPKPAPPITTPRSRPDEQDD